MNPLSVTLSDKIVIGAKTIAKQQGQKQFMNLNSQSLSQPEVNLLSQGRKSQVLIKPTMQGAFGFNKQKNVPAVGAGQSGASRGLHLKNTLSTGSANNNAITSHSNFIQARNSLALPVTNQSGDLLELQI